MRNVIRYVVVAVAAACHAPHYEATPGMPTRTTSVDTVYRAAFINRTRGRDEAPITVYELSDFQCPFCRRFATETFAAIDSLYVRPGKVRWVFVNYPKPEMHPNSPRAAEYAACAAEQGRFWPLHDALFSTQPRWAGLALPDTLFDRLGASAGVSSAALASCLQSGRAREVVDRDLATDHAWRVVGVPSFVVDGRMIVQGAQPLAVFTTALDSVLARVR